MKHKQKCAGILTVIAFALMSGSAALADAVDAYIRVEMRKLHIPGLALAVVRNGRVIKSRGYGVANIEHNIPVSPRTVFEMGSMTKYLTAAAVMILVEEGKIGLDDKITKHFPDAPNSWQRITIRHVLHHTSGIQNHVAIPGYLDLFRTSVTGKTFPGKGELLEEFYKLPMEFEPGETWAYDNTGYYLLGFVIERASGVSYWQFLEDRIFKPLGMTSTQSTDTSKLVPNRASGYEWVKKSYENRPVLSPFIAFSAGSVLSTVEDLARWNNALNGEKLLKRASIEAMFTPAKANDGSLASFSYGLGWFVDAYHGRRFVQHSGGTPGFSSAMYRFLDDKVTIIILTNHSDRFLDQIAIDIAGMYAPRLKRPAGPRDPDSQLTQKLRTVTAELMAGRHDPAKFTRAMQLFLNTATGKSFWQWAAYHGPLNSFTFSDREENAEGPVIRYRVGLGDGKYWHTFRLTPDNRIAQITWW